MSLIDKLKEILASEESEEQKPETEEVVEEVKDEAPQEEVVEEQPVQEETQPTPEVVEDKSASELESLKAQLADAESKISELESAAESDKAALRAAEAKSRLDAALQAGWLTPGQLKESETDDSVFVAMAKDYPDLFDRLQLVMAPKVLKKPGVTEAPADNSTGMSEEELVKRIKQLAAEKGISYAEASNLI